MRLPEATGPEFEMSQTTQALESAALLLPPEERARLAERLLASLDIDPEVETAWSVEVEKRLADWDAGLVEGVLFQNSNEGSSCVSVAMAQDPVQSLAPHNHTCGGFWNALNQLVSEALVAALEHHKEHLFTIRCPVPKKQKPVPTHAGSGQLACCQSLV